MAANALFCATVEFLQQGEVETEDAEIDLAQLCQPHDSMLYPGDTILGNIPVDESVNFEDNGWNVPIDATSNSTYQGMIGDELVD